MLLHTDTIAALATPVGTSAIGMIRVSGALVTQLIAGIFQAKAQPRIAQHADYRAVQGAVLDDVVFTYFRGPHSYTGEDVLEICPHGNPFIIDLIIKDLFARGCHPAEAGEFTKRAFLNGRLDLTQAEAVMDLIHARSEKALACANQILKGQLGREIHGTIDKLLEVIAQVEAYLDFPEEVLPPEDRLSLAASIKEILERNQKLIATNRYGAILRNGIKLVIIGATNAGKSSVLNQLVGHQRALVSPEPGTTRDYIEEGMMLGAHYFRVIDTAGFNERPTLIERQGIDKTLSVAIDADVLLWIVDVSIPDLTLPHELRSAISPSNTLLVWNKQDLPQRPKITTPHPLKSCLVSSYTGFGYDTLRQEITQLANQFQLSTGSEGIAINARHNLALCSTQEYLADALAKLHHNTIDVLLASDLRSALSSMEEIAGKIDNDKILDKLFAGFCIGK